MGTPQTGGSAEENPLPPRVGMMATVRNRRGLIAAVEPFDSTPEGRRHLVRVEYTDADGAAEESILWECEGGTRLLETGIYR